ncbi:MAG: phosphate ABC transporter permease subunit PstC [Bacteroidetes bacterium]|jgi:phosphate transport system permease protein|nr:phosphate ABC transporter permease subunit PstC [Bacteroidota bacterium]
MRSSDLYTRKFHVSEFLAEKLIAATAFLSFAVIILIFVFVFREALPIFSSSEPATHDEAVQEEVETYGEEALGEASQLRAAEEKERRAGSIEHVEGNASLRNLLSTDWQPVSGEPKFGLLPLIVGSLKVSLIAILLAAPLAILAALYTSTFAPKRVKEILKPAIEILAGFPSVVIGFFALIVLATFVQDLFGTMYRLNAFVGGVALSLAVIPIVYTIAEDAIAAVPKSMTEASLALGATSWQTALFVTLPAATPGIFAAVLLGVGRAFGETMIVLMATGNAALMTFNVTDPVRTMSATIGAEMAEVVFGDTHYNVLFLIGSILFIFTFTLNAVAEFYIRRRLLRKFRGG